MTEYWDVAGGVVMSIVSVGGGEPLVGGRRFVTDFEFSSYLSIPLLLALKRLRFGIGGLVSIVVFAFFVFGVLGFCLLVDLVG